MKITEDPEILQVLGLPNLDTNEALKNTEYYPYGFLQVSIWALASAIEIAYQKGYAQGIADHLMNGQEPR